MCLVSWWMVSWWLVTCWRLCSSGWKKKTLTTKILMVAKRRKSLATTGKMKKSVDPVPTPRRRWTSQRRTLRRILQD